MTTYAIDWGDGTSMRVGPDREYAEQLLREASGPFYAKNPAPRVVEVPNERTTMTNPSISAFLSQPTDDHPDLVEDGVGPVEAVLAGREDTDPLTSIAGSLQAIADAVRAGLEQPSVAAELVEAGDAEVARWREAHDDLQDKYEALYAVLAQVEKIVAKSTSKVSLDVKAAINAWRNPEVPDEPEGQQQGPVQPAHDADVEQWRAYALAVAGDQFELTGLDQMNRSQIRTMLGIEQPTA